jgi:hypothetical protein
MKNITTTLFVVISVSSLVLFSGCKKDDPQPETDRVKGLLIANSWRIQTVSVDATDQTTLFTGLTLSFTNTNYNTTNGGVVWPASGTWSFSDNTGKKILRSDGQEITVTEVTATNLKLSLTRAKGTLAPGRVSSVAGNHVFTFIK